MIMAYFTIFYLESQLRMFPDVYFIFYMTFKSPYVWLSLLFVCMVTSTFELLNRAIYKIDESSDQAYKFTMLNESMANNRNSNAAD
jgi:hypothetical protein